MSALKFEICMGKMKVQVHFLFLLHNLVRMICFQKLCEMHTAWQTSFESSITINMPFRLNLPLAWTPIVINEFSIPV